VKIIKLDRDSSNVQTEASSKVDIFDRMSRKRNFSDA